MFLLEEKEKERWRGGSGLAGVKHRFYAAPDPMFSHYQIQEKNKGIV